MHYDSKFGEDSFGHVARLYPERVYAMHRDLKQLEEQEGWKNDPAFAKYLEVVNKFPDASGGYRDDIKDGGKAFFRRAEGTFFENYRAQFNKHIASCVRISDKAATTTKGAPNTARLLPSIVGGHPELAREWATYLFIADERGEIDVGDDDEWFRHHFSKKEIVLDHNEGELPPIKIKVDDCMEYLTGEVNPFELLKIPMVKDNMDFLRRMAAVPDVVAAVDIFDNRTWPVGQDGSKHDFSPLLDYVHKRIAPHCCHGQGVENHVQAAGYVRKTGVGEGRGSDRGTIHSYHIRKFNMQSKLEFRATKKTKEEKDKIKRVWGSRRINMYSLYTDSFTKTLEKAFAELGREQRNELYTFLQSDESRQSTKDKKKLVDKVKGATKKKRKVTKSEAPSNVQVTPDMDGGILFSILTKKAGHEPHVNAEIVERKIEYKLSLPVTGATIAEKTKLLKNEALLDMVEAGEAAAGDKPPNFIKPKSEMMKQLYVKQREVLADKRANK